MSDWYLPEAPFRCVLAMHFADELGLKLPWIVDLGQELIKWYSLFLKQILDQQAVLEVSKGLGVAPALRQ